MVATIKTAKLFGPTGLIGRLQCLWRHMSPQRHIQYGLLLCLMFISALAEVISLGAVLPFLGALAAPDKIMASPYLKPLIDLFGIENVQDLLLPLTLLFICAALFAGAVRLLLLFVSTRLIFATGADLSAEVFSRTLYQPYETHLTRNSSELIAGITNKTTHLMFDIILPSVTLLNSG
ncbi:MAG: ABC transporter ATP-binding protein, partial [Bdellovibrionales bacterium]